MAASPCVEDAFSNTGLMKCSTQIQMWVSEGLDGSS
jgi:hypothetical protein